MTSILMGHNVGTDSECGNATHKGELLMKSLGTTTLTALLALSLAACNNDVRVQVSVADEVACDRQCLIELTDSYLAALVAGDPSAVPLATNIVFVENVTRLMPGEGLWGNAASGPSNFAVYVPDVEQQQAGFMGVIERESDDGNQPVLLAIRLKLENEEITEAEHLIADVNANNMQRLETPRGGLTSEVPAGGRQNYDDLVRIGLSYYDALDDNDGSLMPFADDCQRHENGMITAGPEAGPGPNSDPDSAPVARLCALQLDSQTFVYIDRIENRRLIAADPVTGLSMGLSHFRHPFDNLPYDVIHTDGSTSERNSENFSFDPFDMPAAHIFKVGADGLVHEIEALGFIAPYDSPTGWE
jgi:hypothetical protein